MTAGPISVKNCFDFWEIVIGVEDMNYTTSASPCLQAIRWIKKDRKISVIPGRERIVK
jgi:hypothetical protein